MKKRLILTFTMVVMLALASVLSVSADEAATQMTLKLSNDTPISSTLIGNHAGAFWFANLDNPGGDTAVTIDMALSPGDPQMVKGVGFNLYDTVNGQLVGSGTLISNGLMELVFTSSTTDPLQLQVYNYIDDAQVNFTITAEGLPVAATATATTAAATAAIETATPVSEAAPAAAAVQAMNGNLVGDAGGMFTRFLVTYNTADSVTLDIYYSPADEVINLGVNFFVYGADGEVDARVATGVTGHLQATFTPVAGQQYLIVVQNYIPDVLVSFNIESSVAPASVILGN